MKETRRIEIHSMIMHSIIYIFIVMFMLTSCNCKKTKGHNHQLTHIDKVEATCTKTGVLEHYKCTSCGKYFFDKEGKNEIAEIVIPLSEHIWKDATCTTSKICTICGTTEGTPLGHIYDETSIQWEWSENNEEAGAIFTCKIDATHQERMNAIITKEETTETITYIATITYNGVEYIDRKTITFSQELLYTLNEDGTSYSVIRIKNLQDKNIKIPSTYNQLPVTSIKDSTFKDCSNLTRIVIPNSVTSIGRDAFCNCSSLTSITIPNSVTSIGVSAFESCSSLTNVYYDGTIEDWCKIQFESDESNPMMYAKHIYMRDINHEYKKVTEIKIPNTITHIGDYQFFGFDNITSIEIPNSVTSIGDCAFLGCISLTSIVIPNGITSIGYDAFNNCISLTSITISDSVISIGDGAFYGCSSLTGITVDSNNPIYDSRENCNAIIETATNTLVIGCKNTSIPNSVTSIGSSAFSGCRSLISITIPESVTCIGPAAFSECSSLVSITIPSSVTSIENYAFWNCQYLYEIINHSDLVFELGSPSYGYIAYYAKRIIDKNGNRIENENSKLTITDDDFVFIYEKGNYILKSYISNENEITLPTDINGCEYMINEFTSFTTTSIILPDSITCIGAFAFRGCSSLTSITIPNSATSIEYCAFYGCSSLTNVYYEGTIEDWCNIKFYSLYGTDNSNPMSYAKHFYMKDINDEYIEVTEIKIPDTITSIGDYQFYGFDNITSIEISNSVTNIGKEAFACCNNLIGITIPNNLTTIDEAVFEDCSQLTNVYYDGTIEDWCKIQFKEYDSNPMVYAEHFYMKDINHEYIEVTEIKVPDTITSIGDYQFRGFNNITSIEISDSVKSLGRWTFADCSSLTSITIPNSMTSLGWATFSQCTSITSIIVDENNPMYDSRENCNAIIEKATNTLVLGCKNTSIPNSVTCIGDGAFFGCGSLTSIAIPNRVTSIGEYAFNNCSSLTSITIPDSVKSIGYNAFNDCSSLTNVYYDGTIEDWCNITFESPNSNPMEYAQHFYMKNIMNEYSEVTEIKIPDTITRIGNYQFYGFDNLTSIKIPDSVTSIGYSAFSYCSGLTSITIPNRVTSIGHSAFSGCSNLTNISIPNSVTSIEGFLFKDCSSLTTIILPNSVTSIGYEAFCNCISLTSIVIPDSVKSIENRAFYECISLASITLGNSVKSIGDWAFYGCSSLISIVIPNSVTSIAQYAFYSCSLLSSVTFVNTTGWFIAANDSSTTGTSMDVTNDKTNAKNITSGYGLFFWKRS